MRFIYTRLLLFFDLFQKDYVTTLLFGGMLITMLTGFSIMFRCLKKEYRISFAGFGLFHFISFYFLFSATLPSRMILLGIYWDIHPTMHLWLFAVTWFVSICCLGRFVCKLKKV